MKEKMKKGKQAMNRVKSSASSPHDFLHDLYDRLHQTPMQSRLRALAPWPVGCVFLPWPGLTEDEARRHFRLMRSLGFTCLKQTLPTPEWPLERTLRLALEEGIAPFWYAEGGWEPITPRLLRRLGLPPDLPMDRAIEHPAVQAYQRKVLHRQISAFVSANRSGGPSPAILPSDRGHEIPCELIPAFLKWLKARYGTVTRLLEAWNAHHVGIWPAGQRMWRTWNDVRRGLQAGIPGPREYRHLLDQMRFRADMYVRYLEELVKRQQRRASHVPLRAGGEMGLFLPFASRGTDMEAVADAMAAGGSFYPSIHLAWHFEETAFEFVRPVFMQAQLAADWAKGIWTATWESTGGPQFFSGGKGWANRGMPGETPGFTVDAGTMTQLMLSYIAAGFKGFGFWAWNYRTAGWEAGEYALLDRTLEPTDRARRVGLIARAARRWRRELWSAHKEPLVGILVDWDNEAIWAALAVDGRDHFRECPVRARIGASRAFMDANIPWEYVTRSDLVAGLGPRYRIIYAPALLAIRQDLQTLLRDYVEGGGRLVMDMPAAHLDDFGRVLPTGRGSWFAELFGGILRDFQFIRESDRVVECAGMRLSGFVTEFEPLAAHVAQRRSDGWPAVTERRYGRGVGVLIHFTASLNCWRPGNRHLQDFIVSASLGPCRPPFTCRGALAYRLAAPSADHIFLINDGPACTARLSFAEPVEGPWEDAVTGEKVPPSRPIPLEAHSGRWLRIPKRSSQRRVMIPHRPG